MATDKAQYLVFRLGDKLFATPLLSLKEVVQAKDTFAIPKATLGYMGATNIRNEMVNVIDLATVFDIKAQDKKDKTLLIFRTDRGSVAALVDSLESIEIFEEIKDESNSSNIAKVDERYIIGISQTKNKEYILLIDLFEFTIHFEMKSSA